MKISMILYIPIIDTNTAFSVFSGSNCCVSLCSALTVPQWGMFYNLQTAVLSQNALVEYASSRMS
jgi:hypothetical protein